jgi:hypothetical protein
MKSILLILTCLVGFVLDEHSHVCLPPSLTMRHLGLNISQDCMVSTFGRPAYINASLVLRLRTRTGRLMCLIGRGEAVCPLPKVWRALTRMFLDSFQGCISSPFKFFFKKRIVRFRATQQTSGITNERQYAI